MKLIERYANLSSQQFDELTTKDLPFIISNADFGNCCRKWSAEYLAEKLNDTSVRVHVSQESRLNFIDKNFKYYTVNFSDFLHECNNNTNYWYLRALGNDKRGKEIANLKRHFKPIAEDISYPEFSNFCLNDDSCVEHNCSKRHIFSSVLRVSSRDLVLWTHYDMLDNILLQIKGRKRIIMFPPNDVPYLYKSRDKSQIMDLDQIDLEKYPLFRSATQYEAILEEGDAIFIPALWFHNVTALDFSIGINFFWKDDTMKEFYNKSDVYGNKDLNPASDALSLTDRAIKHLHKLPDKYKDFYLNVMISKINNELYK